MWAAGEVGLGIKARSDKDLSSRARGHAAWGVACYRPVVGGRRGLRGKLKQQVVAGAVRVSSGSQQSAAKRREPSQAALELPRSEELQGWKRAGKEQGVVSLPASKEPGLEILL